ncbi:putative ERAD-associated E3 ubiquitin-protein ligase component HRD3 [Helianthus debilis subsp. tardiflorus]
MRSRHKPPCAGHLTAFLLCSLLLSITVTDRPFILALSQHDLNNGPIDDSSSIADWDELDSRSYDELKSGSWRPIFEPDESNSDSLNEDYYSSVRKLVDAVSDGRGAMEDVASEIESIAAAGNSHTQSLLGFLYNLGMARPRNGAKAFLYHQFAAESGNIYSKLARAYTYSRKELFEKAVVLYAELAETAVSSLLILKDCPVSEPVRIHNGAEENTDALRRSRGEDEDFQNLEYQAQKGNPVAMYKIGIFNYCGLRGFRRDHDKAFSWFSKAVEKGEPMSMELLGVIYARGDGVKRNYTTALEWLTLASKHQVYSAYNGIGYLYLKGYGVEHKNYTKAREYFEKAADYNEGGGHYNLGVMYLKGIGVKKDVKIACRFFIMAGNTGQSKAFYQLAKMFHTGIGLKKNLPTATSLYKLVAERGPWNSLSRWALESYLKGDTGKAFLLYSIMAELGYEVAQSNAAWILDKYGESSMCMGKFGLCTSAERRQRAHSLWWQASKQGNEYAALLIGDGYYYGWDGLKKNYTKNELW